MKKSLYILALSSLVLTSCQDNDAPYNVLVDSQGSGIVAFKQDPIALSRTACNNEDEDHVNSTPRHANRFIPGTYYWIWGYRNIENTTTPNFTDGQFFTKDDNTKDAFYTRGVESPTHYVELSPANKQRLNKTMHLYGMTDNTAGFNDKLPAYTVVNDRPVFNLNVTTDLPDWDYHDLCRGYIYYDPNAEEFQNKSSFDLPFSHVMAQIKISAIQEGQITSTETSEGGVYVEGTTAYDIYLKSIKLYNEIPTAKYEAIANTYDFTTDGSTPIARTTRSNAREIYSNTDANVIDAGTANEKTYLGKKIPLTNDDDPKTNIEAIDLIVPQRKDSGTSASKAAYNFDADWTAGEVDPDYKDAVWMELTITGADAWKFNNEYQLSDDNNGDVTIWLPIKDNTPISNQPLEFLPNHAYNLVVVFHGDNVHVVTIKPLLYPWFDGETESGEKGDKYQTVDIGSPMVFGNVQWNDRYMGSDWVAPTDTATFVKATGFYYQKDRSIPFYPTTYVGGYVYDLNGNIHDLDYAEGRVGSQEESTVTDDTYQKYYAANDNNNVWTDITTMKRIYTTGGDVLFRAGGHWVDPWAREMINDRPVVHPVVSYYLPPEQIEIPGLDTPGDESYKSYVMDYHAYRTTGDYVCTVDDYYDRETGDIIKYTDTRGNFTGNRIMRFVSDMRDVTSGTWADENKHPCPPGWRLPTKEELFTIFPSTPLAGNLTFLRQFGIHDGSVGNNDGATLSDTLPCKEIYLRIPMENPETDMYPLPAAYDQSDDEKLVLDRDNPDFEVQFPSFDPESNDVTQYVISKRHFDESEWNADTKLQTKITKEDYVKYKNYFDRPVPDDQLKAKHPPYVKREWGTIYAIKKQGTVDAYRMRWRVERVQEGFDIYQIVVDKYKCDQYARLEYDIENINSQYFYMNYDWDHPESTVYFPVTGLVADHDMSQYVKVTDEGSPDKDKRLGGPRVYNYGTETIILTSSFTNYKEKRYAAAYRIKITGTDCYSMYLYPSMERLAQGGQVRPVRKAR